jgi:hypothetical protein
MYECLLRMKFETKMTPNRIFCLKAFSIEKSLRLQVPSEVKIKGKSHIQLNIRGIKCTLSSYLIERLFS